MPGKVNLATPPEVRNEPIVEIELPRESWSHGDVLAAVGLAELLRDAGRDRLVRLEARGASFAVIPSRARRPSELTSIPHAAGYRFLQSKSTVAAPTEVTNALDYQATRDEINRLRAQEMELRAKLNQTKDPAQRQHYDEAIKGLAEQWPMDREQWRRITPYLMLQGHETANKLLRDIVQTPAEEFRQLVQRAITALAQGRPSGVDWKVSTVQLFSPNAAKGYARLKPDSTSRGDKSKDAWADPFVEWLRYRGYFAATIPVFHGSKREHIRILTPVPGNLTLNEYTRIISKVTALPPNASPPKIDSLVTLQLALLLVRHSNLYRAVADSAGDLPDDDVIEIEGKAPGDVIRGLAVTNYQSLGSARAVSSLTELAVPGWFPIDEPQDAIDWLAILDEHLAIVRGLEDNHSDEFALLQEYRRFLEQRGASALDALLEFAGAYGNHVFRVRDTGRNARQFTANLLRRVVIAMEPKYAPILEDAGFQAVAAAIRRATVSAMTLKARKAEHRDIRYGLLPDLRRARDLPTDEPLLVAVAEFVDLYNLENARRQESANPPWHARVTTEELVAFTRLVDQFHAPIVGALLCAYGTCTERREPSTGDAEASAPDSGSTAADDPHAPVDDPDTDTASADEE